MAKVGREELSCGEAAAPPEYRLLLAILRHAVIEASEFTGKIRGPRPDKARARDEIVLRHKIAREANRWIFESDLSDFSPFGFAWVCEHLGVDPQQVRNRVIKLRGMEVNFRTLHEYYFTYADSIYNEAA